MQQNRLPNLFIVGFPKTGTTTLFDTLAQHPDIFPSKRKEPGDWENLHHLNKANNFCYAEYMKNFEEAVNQRYLMEGTTRYSLNLSSAKTLKGFNGSAKIVIGIREPISYIASLCFQIEKNTKRERDINEDIKLGLSYTKPRFYEAVRSYHEEFGKENVVVYTFDSFLTSARQLTAEILTFLDLEEPSDFNVINNNLSRKPKTKFHGSINQFLHNAVISKTIRNLLKKTKFYNPETIKQIVARALTNKVNYYNQIVENEENFIHLKNQFREDVRMLSETVGQNLSSKWDY